MKTLLRSSFGTVVIGFALCSSARATTVLATSPMPVGTLDSSDCNLVNVSSSSTVSGTLEELILNSSNQFYVFSSNTVTLAPGDQVDSGQVQDIIGNTKFYCRFSFTGSSKNVRLGACVINSSQSCFAHAEGTSKP
jgi:hypothetical protein